MAADLVNLGTESYKQFEFDEMEGKKDIEWFIEHYVPKVSGNLSTCTNKPIRKFTITV